MRLIMLLPVIALLVIACGTQKKATKAFELGDYQTAIDLYNKLMADNPQNGYYNYMVAESYRLSNRLKDAERYYTNAGGRGINRDTVRFYYAQSLKSNGKYQEARRELDELIKNTTAQALKERAAAEL